MVKFSKLMAFDCTYLLNPSVFYLSLIHIGIRNHMLPRKRYDLGFTIENIVYLELSRRGGKVNIGKYGSTEVDFDTEGRRAYLLSGDR